jgi:hypothetical protein
VEVFFEELQSSHVCKVWEAMGYTQSFESPNQAGFHPQTAHKFPLPLPSHEILTQYLEPREGTVFDTPSWFVGPGQARKSDRQELNKKKKKGNLPELLESVASTVERQEGERRVIGPPKACHVSETDSSVKSPVPIPVTTTPASDIEVGDFVLLFDPLDNRKELYVARKVENGDPHWYHLHAIDQKSKKLQPLWRHKRFPKREWWLGKDTKDCPPKDYHNVPFPANHDEWTILDHSRERLSAAIIARLEKQCKFAVVVDHLY